MVCVNTKEYRACSSAYLAHLLKVLPFGFGRIHEKGLQRQREKLYHAPISNGTRSLQNFRCGCPGPSYKPRSYLRNCCTLGCSRYTFSSSIAHPTKALAAVPPSVTADSASKDHDESPRYAASSVAAFGERRIRRAGVLSDEAPSPDAKARIRLSSLIHGQMTVEGGDTACSEL